MPISLQRCTGQTIIKGPKSNDDDPLLTIKFPIVAGTGQVRGRQRNSRECYSRSLELAKKGPELPQAMEVKKISRGLMETNIDPHLQEDESTAEPVKELTEI